ncbi:MAG: 30S ribosomal protein S6, partial [Acinetobacter sp.]
AKSAEEKRARKAQREEAQHAQDSAEA